jgi:hypothetical protein
LAIANLIDAVSVLGQDGGGPAAAMRHAVLEFPVLSTRADRMAVIRVAREGDEACREPRFIAESAACGKWVAPQSS